MDAHPLESDLLQHRDFLLRLATGLVGGNDAEDLAQDVWTRALEHPRASGSSARAWLARVARNLAVNRFRTRSRREQRERDSARVEGSSGPVAEVEERFELGQRLAAAVAALDEPQRAVILLRFYEGLAHAEIARRLDLPLATVRTRQQRALARLRERLDRELGGREAWSVALVTWVSHQGGAIATVSLASGLGVASAIAIALGLGLAVWWAKLGQHIGEVTYQDKYSNVSKDPPAAPVLSPAVAPASDRERVPVAGAQLEEPRVEALTEIGHTLQGRVSGITTEECRDTRVTVLGMLRQYVWPREIHVDGPVNDDGRFEVDVTPLFSHQAEQNSEPPVELVVWVDHPRHVRGVGRVVCERGVTDDHGDVVYTADEIALVPAAVIRGRVLDKDGSPATSARVEAFALVDDLPEEKCSDFCDCDESGGFALRLSRGGEVAVVALQDEWRPCTTSASAALGEVRDLPVMQLELGANLAGRTLRLGAPIGGASVYLRPVPGRRRVTTSSNSTLVWVEGRLEWGWLTGCRSDADGAFRQDGLAPVEYELYISDLPGTRGGLGRRPDALHVTAPSVGVELEFDGCLITIEARGPADDRTQGRILVRRPDWSEYSMWFRPSEGPATFTAPTHQSLTVQVEADGLSSERFEVVSPGPGEELRRVVELRPQLAARLRVEPRGRADDPIGEVLLSFYAAEDRDKPRYYRSPRFERRFDASSAWTQEAPSGTYWITAWVGALAQTRSYYSPLEFELELTPGAELARDLSFELGGIVRVDARTPRREGGRVQFKLLDALGEPVGVQFDWKMAGAGGGGFSWWYFTPDAPSETETSLSPGDYELVLWDDDLAEQRLPVHVKAGQTTDLAVTMQPK